MPSLMQGNKSNLALLYCSEGKTFWFTRGTVTSYYDEVKQKQVRPEVDGRGRGGGNEHLSCSFMVLPGSCFCELRCRRCLIHPTDW